MDPPNLPPRSQPRFQPPLDFLPVGRVTWARFADNPPAFILKARERTRGRKRAGVLYESRVHTYLCKVSQYYLPGPWIVFSEEGSPRKRWSQPDGLIADFQLGHCTIVEIKLKHTERAWWQIRKQYEPLMRYIWSKGWEFSALEIAQYFDPHTPFPEPVVWVRAPDAVPSGKFGVHLFSGR